MISIDQISISMCGLSFSKEIDVQSPLEIPKTTDSKISLEKDDRYWTCEIRGNVITYRWGMYLGSEQVQVSIVDEGKNIGRSNETTPEEQAVVEAVPKINKRIMEGYEISEFDGVFCTIEFKQKPAEVPAPMLAKNFSDYKDKIPENEPVYYQPKLDGIRCIANARTGELFSRKLERIWLKPVSDMVISIGKNHKDLKWLDGELYSHDLEFQTITSIVRTQKTEHPDVDKIQYHIYDVINDKKCSERMKIVSEIGIVPTYPGLAFQAMEMHSKFVSMGYEGAMMRIGSSLYEKGKRSAGLLKIKTFLQEEFRIIGINKEKFEDTLGTFVLELDDGHEFDARPAFSDQERKRIWDNQEDYDWNKWVATVKFFEYTHLNVPRFPVCLGIRHEADR